MQRRNRSLAGIERLRSSERLELSSLAASDALRFTPHTLFNKAARRLYTACTAMSSAVCVMSCPGVVRTAVSRLFAACCPFVCLWWCHDGIYK